MITKIDSFFGGHIEFDTSGFSATPVLDRNPSNARLASVFDETRKTAQVMDRHGFDTLWLAEHHFQREGYGGIPSIPMLAVYLAQHTENLKFGSFFNTLPAWHPLRLAEDVATADILTRGRFRFGIGRGYIAREVETLGSPLLDNEANRDLFEEQVEIIIKSWNQHSFSHHGRHYDLPARVPFRGGEVEEITLVPRPFNLPVEVWQPITSATQRGFDFMATHGIRGVIAGGTAPGGTAEKMAKQYQETLARTGRTTELGEGLAIGFQIYMADTIEKAESEAAPYYEEMIKLLAPLGRLPHLTEEQIRATEDPAKAPHASLPTVRNAVRDGTWFCGPPEHIHDKILELEDRFPGLDRIFIHVGGPGIPPSILRRDLEWFGTEVMPTLKARTRTATPAGV